MRLSPRRRETLEHLLAGLSEKEVAAALGLSINTVHCYVKLIHERFGVGTRAELMARFLPDVRGAELIELIEGGQLYRRRATVQTWVRHCARSGCGAVGLSRPMGGAPSASLSPLQSPIG